MARVDRDAKNAYWREWYARKHPRQPGLQTVMTLEEVAEKLGVSVETVRQDEKRGLAKLRIALADWGPDACLP